MRPPEEGWEIYQYALATKWTEAGARYLATELRGYGLLTYLAVLERRSPEEVQESILELAEKLYPGSRRKP